MENAPPFIRMMRNIDKKRLATRDVVILWSIREYPGQCAVDHTRRLGYPNHSSLQSALSRLARKGFIEDQREREVQAVPSRYFITEEGEAFWASLF